VAGEKGARARRSSASGSSRHPSRARRARGDLRAPPSCATAIPDSSASSPGRARRWGAGGVPQEEVDAETSPRSSRAGRASRRRLLEGEMEKLVHMEERLHQRVVGQDEAVEAVSAPCAARAPASATPTGRSARSCSSGRPASARRSSPRRSPSCCSTTSGP
jgi:hypothetical protein